MLESAGAPFFDPDRETRALIAANPGMSLAEANAEAWRIGRDRLAAAIANRQSFNFETTLGGATIARMLADARKSGLRVRMWYCGLRSANLHVARVQARVRRGGHDIPEAKIRERFDASRNNLCTLLPSLYELVLYDNSIEADPNDAQPPRPLKLLHYRDDCVLFRAASMPEWAKPIVALSLARHAIPADGN